jgi:hypothetical protein
MSTSSPCQLHRTGMIAGCTDSEHASCRARLMTGIDLIVLAPWIVFGAGLAIVCVVLFRVHRASRRQAGRSSQPSCGQAGAPVRPDRSSAGKHEDQQGETQQRGGGEPGCGP